jgi:hypothetical protein
VSIPLSLQDVTDGRFHIDGSHRMYQFSDITAKEKEQRRRIWARES